MCWYGATTRNQRGERSILTAIAMIEIFLQSAALLATTLILGAGIMYLLIKLDDRRRR